MLLIGLIIILAIFRNVSPFLNLGFGIHAHIGQLKGNFSIEAFENQKPALVMFYAPWCGHCKRCKPEFDRLMNDYKGNVKIIAIDADENKEIAKIHNIEGFPTIRYYPEGFTSDGDGNVENFKEYTGDRTYSNFIQYLDTVKGVSEQAPDNAAPVNM
jgi:protein disulfide-isomerase A6